MASSNGNDGVLNELNKLMSAPPAFRAPAPPIYRGPESADEDVDGYPPAPIVQFTGRHDADGQPELVAAPRRGLVPKARQRTADVPAALLALAQGGGPPPMTPMGHPQAQPAAPAGPGMPGEGDVSQLKPSFPQTAQPQGVPPAYPAQGYPQPGYAQPYPTQGYPQAQPGYPQPGYPQMGQPQNFAVDMAIGALNNAFSSLQMLEMSGAIPPQRGLSFRQRELLEEVQRVLGRLNAPNTPR